MIGKIKMQIELEKAKENFFSHGGLIHYLPEQINGKRSSVNAEEFKIEGIPVEIAEDTDLFTGIIEMQNKFQN